MVFPFSLCLKSVLGQLRLCIISSYTEKAGGPRWGCSKYVQIAEIVLGPYL
jgi:hypothetical protein